MVSNISLVSGYFPSDILEWTLITFGLPFLNLIARVQTISLAKCSSVQSKRKALGDKTMALGIESKHLSTKGTELTTSALPKFSVKYVGTKK